MEEFRIGQLTKELVASRRKGSMDPCETAAALVKETLALALKGIPAGGSGQEGVIEDACRGGITGLLLADQDLARGAVLILEAACHLAADLDLDPTALMVSALKGLADLRRFVPPETLFTVQTAIEKQYLGVGEVFAELIAKAPAFEADKKTPA